MNRTKTSLMGLVSLCLAGTVVPEAGAVLPSYAFMDVGSLGGVRTEAYDINNAGQIVGWGKTATGGNRAFRTAPNVAVDPTTDLIPLLNGGTQNFAYSINSTGAVAGDANSVVGDRGFRFNSGSLNTISPTNGNWTYASKINESNQIAGSTAVSNFYTHAMLYSGTQSYDLGTLGGRNSYGYGINSSGVVVGSSELVNNSDQSAAFAWTPTTPNGTSGTMVAIGNLGGNYSYAYDINDAGGIVGGSTLANDIGYQAFYRPAGGAMISLGTLGGSSSEARSINSLGQIVGYAKDASEATRAFLYSNGVMHDLNNLMPDGSGWTLTTARAINDRGQIVGVGRNPLGETRSFVLTPISTWAVDSSGTWSTVSNWLGGVPASGAPVSFTGAISTARTITLDAPAVVGMVTFDSPQSYTLQGQSIALSGIRVQSGAHTIASNVQFNAGTTIAIDNESGLTLSGSTSGTIQSLELGSNSTLDLGSNHLVVNYTGESPLTVVREKITQAYAGGTWSGAGITSTLLRNNPQAALGIGYAEASGLQISEYLGRSVDDSTLLIRYTLQGDTNLDGAVNFDDLLSLAQAYGTPQADWIQGDSNYDGAVTFDDLLKLAQNYGATLMSSGDLVVDSEMHHRFMQDWAFARAITPEPSVLLMALSGLFVSRKRFGV